MGCKGCCVQLKHEQGPGLEVEEGGEDVHLLWPLFVVARVGTRSKPSWPTRTSAQCPKGLAMMRIAHGASHATNVGRSFSNGNGS